MQITSDEKRNFILTLLDADWYYMYSDDPRAREEGERSVHRAIMERKKLTEKYPDDKNWIDETWLSYKK